MGHEGSSAALRRRHRDSVARRIREVCVDAADTAELIEGLRRPLADALGLSGMLLSATDPHTTTLATATVVEDLPSAMSVPWMHNEFLEGDVNKFRWLHRSGAAPTTIHRATGGHPERSARHRHLHQPNGLGPEARTTFSLGNACWGVANLVREAGAPDFGDGELAWLQGLRPVIAAGIQRTTTTVTGRPEDGDGPGVVTLDPDGTVASMTAAAGRMLADLWLCPFGEDSTYQLPGEAYMIATLARARSRDLAEAPPPATRLRGRSGRWLTIRGDHTLDSDGALSELVLVIEPSRPTEILPVVMTAYGLTPREREVVGELSSGRTTGEVATRLFISEHTVRDHVKSIFAKTGTGSRGELMSVLYQHHADPGAG